MDILKVLNEYGGEQLDGRHLDAFKPYVLSQLMQKNIKILDNPKYQNDVDELEAFGMLDMARGAITTKGAMALKQYRKERLGDGKLNEASYALDDITPLHYNILKRLNNDTLDFDNMSDNVENGLGDLDVWGIIKDYEITYNGKELLNILNGVGTKQSSTSKARNRLRAKKKIGDTDINLRTGNKFLNGGRNQKPGGGPRMKNKRANDVRRLFGFDSESN